MIFKNIDKNNLHHAYLIEGGREEILPQVLKFIEELGVSTSQNADFSHIVVDSFKVEDARNLKAFSAEKSNVIGKRIFLISANNFLLEAQNTLLKIFEEPIEDTHFFLIVPDKNILLKTLISRFYVLSSKMAGSGEITQAEKFIKMPLITRIEFIKELLKETDEEADEEIITQNSIRARALKFLNAFEVTLHSKTLGNSSVFTLPGVPGGTYADKNFLMSCFSHIFKVRKFLRMPGSSTKNLMESVALIVPNFKN